MMCLVVITRGKNNSDLFFGEIKAETTTHYLITHVFNSEIGEWIAKKSTCVNVTCLNITCV